MRMERQGPVEQWVVGEAEFKGFGDFQSGKKEKGEALVDFRGWTWVTMLVLLTEMVR